MEIPLVLSSPRSDRLVYGFPVWFRIVMGLILAIIATALLQSDTPPGILAWLVLAILVLGILYEDKWTFDAAAGQATHRAGLIIAARSKVIGFADILHFRIVPFVKGTIPGTEDEKIENKAALEGKRADDDVLTKKRANYKKPFLSLELECVDGIRYLIDLMPARKSNELRSIAGRIADLCEKAVTEA